jgi:hypothetical protein
LRESQIGEDEMVETRIGSYADFAAGRPGGANLVRAGFGGVVRYASQSAWKNLTSTEVQDYRAINLRIHLVYQDGRSDQDKGISGGIANAERALLQALNLGWDGRTGCIYFAPKDADVTSESYSKTREYFKGIGRILDLRNIGVYGDADVINGLRRDGLATYFWQSASKSFGPNVPCHMRQLAKQSLVNDVTVDHNDVFEYNTGALFNPLENSQMATIDDVRNGLNEAKANFPSFAVMISNANDNGLLDLMRHVYNAVYLQKLATADQVGIVGLNVSNVLAAIQALDVKVSELSTAQGQTIDYERLANAIVSVLISGSAAKQA